MQCSNNISGAAYKMRNMTAAHLARYSKELLTASRVPNALQCIEIMQAQSSQANTMQHCSVIVWFLQYADVDLQQYQIKMKHEPRQLHDAVDTEYAAAVKLTAKGGRRPVGFDAKSEKAQREAGGAATPDAMAALVRKSKKR